MKPDTNRQAVVDHLNWVRVMSNMMLKDFPESKVAHQTGPHDNHVLWVLGHLAHTGCWMASNCDIQGMPTIPNADALFGMGSKPSPDASKYPSYIDLKNAFDQSHAALIKWYQTAPESALSASLKEKTGGFADNAVDAGFKLAWHEGWHFGQVATMRKALGLKSAF